MKIQIIAVGKHMPEWVETGYDEYAKRLSSDCDLQLIEIAAGKRGKNADIVRLTRIEGEQMLAAIPNGHYVIALDVLGQSWSTERLADKLQHWKTENQSISLLIGGPEGLAPDCLKRADLKLSLSALTLPHPLVRIVLAEQLYRAFSILKNHPYHRS
jgi:23S rRNA (pseudouridine1915-N3)-methyltransferase